MADVNYADVIRLAEQLTPQEQAALIKHLQSLAEYQQLNAHEWITLLHASILSKPVKQEPSPRRQDWYDDGR